MHSGTASCHEPVEEGGEEKKIFPVSGRAHRFSPGKNLCREEEGINGLSPYIHMGEVSAWAKDSYTWFVAYLLWQAGEKNHVSCLYALNFTIF